MKLSIPVYVEVREGWYHVRPLFFPNVTADAEVLGRAVARLSHRLRGHLESLGDEARHDALAACTFQPQLHPHQVQVAVETGRGTVRARLLVITLEALGRRLALVPALPGLMFDLERGERLEDRVTDQVSKRVREREREEDVVEMPAGRAWITDIEVPCAPPRRHEVKEPASLLALLGGQDGPPDGAAELRRVGRRLDDLHPDDLERSILREPEVARLLRALDQPDRRPVLVRGPRRVGKTALVHEAVHRRVEARSGGTRATTGSTWLLAPQRLISGMQFLGQWEARLVAILETAKKHDHVLYFDDLPGLFTAGPSASSDLSVAAVLKPFIERRDVRILGEITPAALRVLQERDRGLADMFEIVTLDELPPADTLRVVMDGVRRAEARQKTRFTPEAVGLVVDLQRRLVRDAAFPGKACVFVQHLAARHRDGRVTREAVLDEFHTSSGLKLELLDDQRRLSRDDVLAALRRQIIGQEEAVQAMADAVGVAKARIAASTRPLASLLFLGPTGVGKTQCARALATCLFGEESHRLVRFDMNEYVSASSVSRLVGTFASPAGLLTSAVRQAPFCVLLLDEIEKAHPDVFNLLLQVLGDGRLTDAHGRTVDFTQAIVIMTSNLGVQETSRPLGFRTEGTQEGLVYRRAAEQFFAPEFFNRLDRIVGFERLSREDVGRIARQLMGGVLAREGLVRRQCILQVDSRAFESIVEEGFHPLLGARALKRAVERHVAAPLASRLAGLRPSGVTLLALFAGRDGVSAAVHPFRQARSVPSLLPAPGEPLSPFLRAIETRLDSLEDAAEGMAPPGPVDSQRIEAVHMQYFRLREGLERARRSLARQLGRRSPSQRPHRPPRPRPGAPERRWLSLAPPDSFADILMDLDLRAALRRTVEAAGPATPGTGQVDPRAEATALWRDTALLSAVAAAEADEEALVWIRGLDDGDPRFLDLVAQTLVHTCIHGLDLDADFVEPPAALSQRALWVRGTAAWRLLHGEQGTHLFLQTDTPQPVAVVVQRVAEGTARASLDALRAGRAQWIEAMRRGQATFYEAPHPLGDVIRLHDSERALDLRSGAVVEGLLDAMALRELILGGLP